MQSGKLKKKPLREASGHGPSPREGSEHEKK